MPNEDPKSYRCKLIAADGAYRYVTMRDRLDRISMALSPTLKVNIGELDGSTTMHMKRREYELYGREGNIWIYREIV